MNPIRVIPRRSVPWRTYALAAILVAAGPLIFYGWMRHWDRVPPGAPAVEPNSWIAAKSESRMQAAAAFKPIMDTQVIAQAQPRDSLIGNPVTLVSVEVRSVTAGGFWVSQLHAPMIFVAAAPDARATPVQYGESVNLEGVIQRLPSTSGIQQRWPGLSGPDLQRLEEQAVYVEASEVTVNGQY
jgi:hypothetical protein